MSDGRRKLLVGVRDRVEDDAFSAVGDALHDGVRFLEKSRGFFAGESIRQDKVAILGVKVELYLRQVGL